MSNTKYHLQPLRIPTGWTIVCNELYEIDSAGIPQDDRHWLLVEDLLQMRQDHFNRLLDVGWYPHGDIVEGAYGLVMYEGDFHGKLLFELRTVDHSQLVAEIERLLLDVSEERL